MPSERSTVDESREQLLEEQRVALRAGDDECAHLRGQPTAEQVRHDLGRILRREGSEIKTDVCTHHRGRLGPRRRDEQKRRDDALPDIAKELEQGLFGPVEVLDHEHEGLRRCPLAEELDPRCVETLADDDRVNVPRYVEPEREAEDRPVAEAFQRVLRRIRLEKLELLSQHVRERAVGETASVGRAARGSYDGGLSQAREVRSSVAEQGALADAGVTRDDDELRRPPLEDTSIRGLERRELPGAADERLAQAAPRA